VKPTFHTEKMFGNRFAYFEFADPKGAQIISHTFQATVWQLDWDVKPQDVELVEKWPASFDPYRRAESGLVVNDRVKELAFEIERGGAGHDVVAIVNWVNSNLTYDHSITSLEASTEHALRKRRGDCSDFHGLCASLGRALGVPTRITYGLHLFPKNAPAHCKLEAYLHPYGWVSFDVSETQRLSKLIETEQPRDRDNLIIAARQRMRRGFRDNTWLLMTKGTDYDLAPPARRKVPLVSTIYAEADGRPLPTPDPADVTRREFAWMTAHRFTADREVPYPFKDWKTLRVK
jgi:transglutaminase-like putative cysteine protease